MKSRLTFRGGGDGDEGEEGEEEEDEDDDDADDEGNRNEKTNVVVERRELGSAQSYRLPLFPTIFAQIEQFGAAGVSLKQIGRMFAFDFYKSRRMGNNLQAHPEIVTIMKETNKGKSKFQTIALRRFLSLPPKV